MPIKINFLAKIGTFRKQDKAGIFLLMSIFKLPANFYLVCEVLVTHLLGSQIHQKKTQKSFCFCNADITKHLK